MKKGKFKGDPRFLDTMLTNERSYVDYLERFKKIALSMFEWVNLPKSMDERFLESCLYYFGEAALLKDDTKGFINTQCCSNGQINIYGLPTSLHCYSFGYNADRKLYTGDNSEQSQKDSCILVLNSRQINPMATKNTIELMAQRMCEAERSIDVNIKSIKTPLVLTVPDTQRLTVENAYNQYSGNMPFILGVKDQFDESKFKAINTGAPYIGDKLIAYKKEIWNEFLTFMGINNVLVDKKERLVTDEANANNEVVNLNLQSFLIPRQEACKKFNDLFGLTGTDKEISVKVRSDLYNVIKQEESIVSDFNHNGIDDEEEGVVNE